MKSSQVILLLAGLVLVVFTFEFGRTRFPAGSEEMPLANRAKSTQSGDLNFESVLTKAKTTLNAGDTKMINDLNVRLSLANSDESRAALFAELGQAWTHTGNIIVGGYYFEKASMLRRKNENLDSAAIRFFVGFQNEPDSEARLYAAQQATEAYQQLLNLDSANTDYANKLAECYIDGEGNVMQGVLLLKKVEAKDPFNVTTNLILGRLSISSGQYDKAVDHLQKVIQKDPKNVEGYLELGEAYRALGRKDDAVSALEKCKTLTSRPDFIKQIDSYIQQIKNS